MGTDSTSPYRWHWRPCFVQYWTARPRDEFVNAKECLVDASICIFEKRRDHRIAGNRHDYGEVGERLLVSVRIIIRADTSESRVPKLQACQQRPEGKNDHMDVAFNTT